jgi:transposase
MLTAVYPNCAGLDVHKRFVTVCRLTVDEHGITHPERCKFSTMTPDLEELATCAGGKPHPRLRDRF